MPDEYGGMSISDWNSAKATVTKHLGALAAKDQNYRGIYDTILIHMIVDAFMVRESPKHMSADEFITKYTKLCQDGLGINFHSLDTDNDA